MAFIETPDVARVAVRQSLFGQDVINTLWFQRTGLGSITASELTDLNSAVFTWWDNFVSLALSTDLSLVDITSTSQDSVSAPSVVSAMSSSGVLAGASLPGSCCITVSFRTAQRGRSGRGRNYISGLRESDVSGNVLGNGPAADLIIAYEELIGGFAIFWEWGVVSHYLNNAPRAAGFFQVINDATIVDANLDSQRRRLTGRGS